MRLKFPELGSLAIKGGDSEVVARELQRALPTEILPQDGFWQHYLLQALRLLNRISFEDTRAEEILAAIDEVITESVGIQTVRLPRWLTDFLVRLASIKANSTVLDLYSSYGDVATAGLLHGEHARSWSISPNPTGLLWAKIQRLIIGARDDDCIAGSIPPYDVYSSSAIPKPTHIIVTPPFGMRLPSDSKRSRFAFRHRDIPSEELYLELALDWVQDGGRVIALVPEGLLFAESRKYFREFLLNAANIRAVIGFESLLPWTSIRISTLVLEKSKERIASNSVFMARVGRIEETTALDSRSIQELASVLDAYERWNEDGRTAQSPSVWSISAPELNADNLTIDHYDPTRNIQSGKSARYPMIPLREIAEIARGSNLTLAKKGDLPVIGPGSIRPMVLDALRLDRTNRNKLTSNPVTARVDDVVVNAVGTQLGSAAVVGSDLADTYVSRNVILVRPKPSLVLPEYLAAAINSDYVKEQLTQISRGSVFKMLSMRALQDIAIPLPDLETQGEVVSRIKQAFDNWMRAKSSLADAETAFKEQIRKLGEGGGK